MKRTAAIVLVLALLGSIAHARRVPQIPDQAPTPPDEICELFPEFVLCR